jgi:hypothetical protein
MQLGIVAPLALFGKQRPRILLEQLHCAGVWAWLRSGTMLSAAMRIRALDRKGHDWRRLTLPIQRIVSLKALRVPQYRNSVMRPRVCRQKWGNPIIEVFSKLTLTDDSKTDNMPLIVFR